MRDKKTEGAGEKRAEGAPVKPPEPLDEDPFDDIFKIFNRNK